MLGNPPRPLTEALGGVAAALVVLALGGPWWLLVATYLTAAAVFALLLHLQRRPWPGPHGRHTPLPRH